MLNLDDYKAYIKQNKDFINNIKAISEIVYDHFDDAFKVLDFIEDRADKYEKIEEEFEVIFEAGFSFIHEQIEELKTIYNHYFDNDFITFKRFDKMVAYSLYLNDLIQTLTEDRRYKGEIKTTISSLNEKIDKILRNKESYSDDLFEEFNNQVGEVVPVGTLSTSEIYGRVQEELMIEF